MSLKKASAAVFSVIFALSGLSGCGGGTDSPVTTDSSVTTDNSVVMENPPKEDEPNNQQSESLWSYGQVAFGGAGFVTGVYATGEENLFYARTDVGGAYRWVESEQRWKSLNYWVSEDDRGLLGIDGLAVDPTDASKLYLLAGTDYFSNGKTALLKSTDYGESFEVIELSDLIRVHGNGMGRGNGERIAIDPNSTDIIFAGGRTGGMIKSTDGGITWNAVGSFPVTFTANSNGINCIVFDPSEVKDGVTQRIYASVSQKNSDNLFVSEDAGETWSPVPNACLDFMPQRMKLDSEGTLYVTYGSDEGPWNAQSGTVYKYKDGEAKEIAPSDRPFGDILIDPEDPKRLVLVTTNTWVLQPNGAYGDTFFTSTDGGDTWTDLISSMVMSTDSSEWIEDCAIHWCSSLMMNPFNSNEIMVNSGNGIFRCDNIWDEKPAFYFNSYGIEECVPLDILSLEDYPLAVTIGDYDGFMSEDIFVPGERFLDKIGSTASITIAAQNKDYWAKLGTEGDSQLLTYSTDAGKTWESIKKSPEKGARYSGGTIAFTADGSRLLWSPAKAASVYYTDDFGETWNTCEGIIGMGFYLMGDPINSNYVYALGSSVFRSVDGGKTFEKISGIFDPSGERLCVDQHNEGTFYVPDLMGLYKVTEHGDSVEKVPNVRSCEVMGLGKAKTEGGPLTMYVMGIVEGGNGKGIYMSDDDGATWVPVNDDKHLFGGTGNGKFISGDMNVYGRCYMSTVGLGLAYFDLKDKG